MIRMEHIIKIYRLGQVEVPALRGIDLEIKPGEMVAITGPSGSGKSTLLNLLGCLDRPTSGKVIIDGVDATRLSDVEASRFRNRVMGFVFQQNALFPWRTVLQNIEFGLEVQGFPRKLRREIAWKLAETVGLKGYEHCYPKELSGGMKQRAALLRTVACHREIMLLDEPFGALDALTRATLQDWLLGIWRRFRHTVLFITHDVEEAIYLSDRVYVLSARPAQVVKELAVPLPRPRHRDMVTTPAFISCKAELLEALQI